ncbi:MAG: hypothetical protein ACI97K_000165 [Glaciecola sp.]|jgi:hypothetical protein
MLIRQDSQTRPLNPVYEDVKSTPVMSYPLCAIGIVSLSVLGPPESLPMLE